MRRAYPNSGLALKLRRLRGRFGIAAPRVTVRSHIPWYWQALGLVVVLAVALALAGWIFDAGRRIAGFDRSESSQEIGTLRTRVAELEAEVVKLRAMNNASDSNLQIERTVQQQLKEQVQTLEAENNRLKEENAVFERLAQGEGGSIAISSPKIVADGGGRYRYQFFVSQNGEQRGREFKGSLQIVAALQPGGADGMMTFPRPNDPDAARFAIAFKHFRRIDGVLKLPAGAKLKSVEFRVMQDGAVRAAQTVNL